MQAVRLFSLLVVAVFSACDRPSPAEVARKADEAQRAMMQGKRPSVLKSGLVWLIVRRSPVTSVVWLEREEKRDSLYALVFERVFVPGPGYDGPHLRRWASIWAWGGDLSDAWPRHGITLCAGAGDESSAIGTTAGDPTQDGLAHSMLSIVPNEDDVFLWGRRGTVTIEPSSDAAGTPCSQLEETHAYERQGAQARLYRPLPADVEGVVDYVIDSLPKFVYNSNYGNLDSEIYLPHVKEDLPCTALGARDSANARPLKVLVDLVGLSSAEIFGARS